KEGARDRQADAAASARDHGDILSLVHRRSSKSKLLVELARNGGHGQDRFLRMIVLDARPAVGLRSVDRPQERLLRTRAIAASIIAAAASVMTAGCVIQQRAQGVLPTQPLPPPPSEPGVKAGSPVAAQASPPAPERKPLSVPQ
ncbi:MAG: hypothetical protein ACJ8DO_01175, partial [Microvirga sp.]